MKVFVITLTLLITVAVLITPVLADDEADVRAEMLRFLTALNTGDVDGFMEHYPPKNTSFVPENTFLSRYESLDDQRKSWKATVDSGQKLDLKLRHLEIEIYNHSAAVVTCYVTGTATLPDGTIREVNGKRSGVMIKQEGQWKEVHHHRSPLRLP